MENENGQRAGYNVGSRETFPIGSLREFLDSEEFMARMREMERVGHQYLESHPNPNWWDITGSSLERVYGPDELPRVAGLTAATAPMSAPRPNLQTMSEYMRRHLAGEPMVQPDWRVPEGAMSRKPGKMIGSEKSRAKNLNRGDALEELGGAKVENERRALLGDPVAVVLDRHWARLAEKPDAGVFVGSKSGDIASDKIYNEIADAVRRGAEAAGRSPRDFSADVWTGIRETIRHDSELYGQKFKKGSVQGESKSYADHFDDLLRDKAEKLQISKEMLERKLRSGDANLLAWILAAPAGMAAYRSMMGRDDAWPDDSQP